MADIFEEWAAVQAAYSEKERQSAIFLASGDDAIDDILSADEAFEDAQYCFCKDRDVEYRPDGVLVNGCIYLPYEASDG